MREEKSSDGGGCDPRVDEDDCQSSIHTTIMSKSLRCFDERDLSFSRVLTSFVQSWYIIDKKWLQSWLSFVHQDQ
eukprot:755804-Hanusia_phi.AAC.1